MRAVVPTSNLLEFRPQDGWAPLCAFLGKDVPTKKEGLTKEGAETKKRAEEDENASDRTDDEWEEGIEEEFPHINDADALVKLMKWVWCLLLIRAFKKISIPATAVAVIVGGVWYALLVR